MTAGILIAAAGIILLIAVAWAWLRPRHGIHERREQAAALEADAFLEALRDVPAPADERLADTDVRIRLGVEARGLYGVPPVYFSAGARPAAGPAMPLGLPASPPAPAGGDRGREPLSAGAGATTVTPGSVAARYRRPPALPRVGVVIPARDLPVVPELVTIARPYSPGPVPDGHCGHCGAEGHRTEGHQMIMAILGAPDHVAHEPWGTLPQYVRDALHHETTAEAVEADSMTMPAVSIDA